MCVCVDLISPTIGADDRVSNKQCNALQVILIVVLARGSVYSRNDIFLCVFSTIQFMITVANS